MYWFWQQFYTCSCSYISCSCYFLSFPLTIKFCTWFTININAHIQLFTRAYVIFSLAHLIYSFSIILLILIEKCHVFNESLCASHFPLHNVVLELECDSYIYKKLTTCIFDRVIHSLLLTYNQYYVIILRHANIEYDIDKCASIEYNVRIYFFSHFFHIWSGWQSFHFICMHCSIFVYLSIQKLSS